MSSLLIGSHKQEVLCSQVPQRTQCNVFFIFFCLPAQSNTHPWKAVGRSKCLKNTPRICPPFKEQMTAPQCQAETHCRSSVCPTRVWILECTQLVFSGALPQHSRYFLNPFCVLPTWWVVVTLQKSPPSPLATQGTGPLPMVEPWAPGCLTLPNIL